MNRLYKTSRDKKICGVCGGLGRYFGIDPTIIRVVWGIGAISGFGIIAYFVAAFIMPYDYEIEG